MVFQVGDKVIITLWPGEVIELTKEFSGRPTHCYVVSAI
jgi:hypothetical protein